MSEITERAVLVAARSTFSGPLPEPSDYAEYGRIEPTAPDRILGQWEEESRHRRAYEMEALKGANRRGEIGLRNALVFALAALGAAVAAMYFGMPGVAVTIGGGTIVTGIGAFVYQQKRGGTEKKGSAEQGESQPPARRS